MGVDPSAQAVLALTAEGFRHERDGDIPGAIAIYERALAIAEGDRAQCASSPVQAPQRPPPARPARPRPRSQAGPRQRTSPFTPAF